MSAEIAAAKVENNLTDDNDETDNRIEQNGDEDGDDNEIDNTKGKNSFIFCN